MPLSVSGSSTCLLNEDTVRASSRGTVQTSNRLERPGERRRQSKQTSKLRSDGGSEAGTQSLNQTQNPPSEQGAESSTKHASSLSLELDLGEPRLDLFDYSSTSLSGGAVSPSNNEPNLSWPNISQDLLGIPDQLTRDIALPASPFSNSLSPSGLIETSLATIEPGLLFGFSPSSSPFLPSSTSSLPASFPDSYLLPVSELTLIRACEPPAPPDVHGASLTLTTLRPPPQFCVSPSASASVPRYGTLRRSHPSTARHLGPRH